MSAPRRTSRSPSRAVAGFTIVEIMVVVVILGLLAGLTTFSFQRMLPREQFIADVRALAERLREARAQAISRNAEFWLVYQIDEERYWISTPYNAEGELAAYARRGDESTGAAEDAEQYKDRVTIYETQLGKGIDLSSVTLDGTPYLDGELHVVYSPLGTTSEHWIVLKQQSTGTVATIEVQGLTGLITYHDGLWSREPANDNDFN
jgi:prepilin-type N-terminal cleavage/methylation domain-containing protein